MLEANFYLFAAIYCVWEIIWITRHRYMIDGSKEFKELLKRINEGHRKLNDREAGLYLKFYFPSLGFFLWKIVGFFTMSGLVFLIHLLLQSVILPKFLKSRQHLHDMVHRINSYFCLAFGLFVIYNKYFLQINLSIF